MIYKGYKIRVRCIDWEQIEVLNKYWRYVSSHINIEKIVGLGMNWTDDYLYFDYALGVIDDETTLKKLKSIDFSKADFNVEYIEIELPNIEEWESFKGKNSNIKQIYENDVNCYEKSYDYELEYIDSRKNIEIKIHYQ